MYKDQIRRLYEHFSPGYRRIANFLLAHYQDAAFMTAAEIARTVQVDTALVVRFAQRLGYPGFPELITDVQTDVKRDLQAVYVPPEGDGSPVQVMRRNLQQDRNNLEFMLQHLDAEVVQTIVDLVHSANRVFVVGEDAAGLIAQAFAMRLVALGYNASAISSEILGQAATLAGLRSGDVLIGIGITAMSLSVATLVQIAKDSGAATVGIVSSMANPVAAVAQYVLNAPVLTVGIMPSWTASASILHALAQVLASQHGELAANWAVRTDRVRRTYIDMLSGKLASMRQSSVDYNLEAEQPADTGNG